MLKKIMTTFIFILMTGVIFSPQILFAATATQTVHITVRDAIPPDTQAPTTPAGLTATAISSTQIDLSWAASTDNVGVTGYKIYRDDSLLSTINYPLSTYSDTGLQPSTTYTYAVSAYDAAGNESVKSIQVAVTTQAISPSHKVVVLTLDKAAAAVSQYPVSSGIPFPEGELFSTDNLRLLDSQNQEIPMQAHSLVNWPDGSVKSALVQFQADVSQIETKSYSLEYGAGVSKNVEPQIPVKVIEDPSIITVENGKIKLEFSKKSFTLFNQVWLDKNDNGVYEDSEKMMSESGDIFLVNAYDNKEYKASLFADPTYTIEENGPIRAVIKAEGKLQTQTGEQLTDFKIWLYVYTGKEYVAVDYTLVDSRDEENIFSPPPDPPLKVTSYGLKIPFDLLNPSYSFGGEDGQVYSGEITGEHYLYQFASMDNFIDWELHPYEFAYEGAGVGKKAPGWMDVSNSTAGISVMIKNFWQQFPKEFNVTNQNLTIFLHPAKASLTPPVQRDPDHPVRPNYFYSPREGMAKTYQLFFNFHKGNQAAQANSLNKIFQVSCPLVTASASWYAKSKVFSNIIEAGPWSLGFDQAQEEIYRQSIEPSTTNGNFAYSWRDFGDRPIAIKPGLKNYREGGMPVMWSNDNHFGSYGFFIQYLRTFDKRFWELGEIASRHVMDIDISHSIRKRRVKDIRDPAKPRIDLPPGEIYGPDVIEDHHNTAFHVGHAHISGLPPYYLLTGDKRALEVIKEVGDWWVKMDEITYGVPISNPYVSGEDRDYAWPLFVVNEIFRATGDPKYLKDASLHIQQLIDWWQQPSDHWVAGEVVGHNDWTRGNGWWAKPSTGMGNLAEGYNGVVPWQTGPLISAVIDFYELNKDYNYVDNALVKEMLFQTMNFTVKHGWIDVLPSGYFVYSESKPTKPAVNFSLLFDLSYLYKLYYLENKDGKLQHPEWYDTVEKWLSIAWREYEDWGKVYDRPGFVSAGGWGNIYHTFYAKFFAEMREIEILSEYSGIKPPDTNPPGPINDLIVQETKSTSVVLVWTSTGDDSNEGTATRYDIRYSTSPITAENFSQAMQLDNPPSPKVAGYKESITINNLTPLSAYYFAIKAIDEDDNIGAISNIATANTPELDLISPASISDLAIESFTFKSVSLTWTATGDDGTIGNASSYDLMYSTFPITNDNFNQGVKVKMELPNSSGTKEKAGVFALNPNTTYYFAIKATDNAENSSDLSNIVFKTLPAPPKGFITEVFQEGNQGYQGTQDTFILESHPFNKFGSSEGIVAGKYMSGGGYDYLALIKFGLSTFPSNVTIKEAYIELYLTDNPRNRFQKLIWSYLKQPWQESEVNWYQYDANKNWEVAGIKGEGDKNNSLEDPNGLLITELGTPNIWKRFNLSPFTVKKWIDKTLPNEGIVIEGSPDSLTFTAFGFTSKEIADPNLRPKLTITYEYIESPADIIPPSIPQGLQATAVSSSQINLSWTASTDNVGVAGYKIYRDGALVTSSQSPVTSYSDTGLEPETTYSYTVSAYDGAGNESERSIEASATTLASDDTEPPRVRITNPQNRARISGIVSIEATATDSIGVAGVQFKLDGVNLEAEDTTAPYQISWDTVTAENGSYALEAAARDAAGNTTISESITVTVANNHPPILKPIGDKSVDEGQALDFTVEAADEDNDTLTYSVSSLPTGASFVKQAFVWTPTYLQEGSYEITFSVRDSQELSDSETIVITINDVEIENPITFSGVKLTPAAGIIPLQVAFEGAASSKYGPIIRYEWDFEDRGQGGRRFIWSSQTTAKTNYTYSAQANWTPTLKAVDILGFQDTYSLFLEAQDNPNSPKVELKADKTQGAAPLTTAFEVRVSSKTGIAKYEWDFEGDGIYEYKSRSGNAAATYTRGGAYLATLKVTDFAALSSIREILIQVDPNPNEPKITLAVDKTVAAAPARIILEATNLNNQPIIRYEWDFNGDGIYERSTSSGLNSVHCLYRRAGTYKPKVRVTTKEGLSAVAEAVLRIKAAPWQISKALSFLKVFGFIGEAQAAEDDQGEDRGEPEPNSSPVSEFTIGKIDGEVPLEIDFTNISKGDLQPVSGISMATVDMSVSLKE